MYHEGNRQLQDAFGSRALADRLDEKLRHDRFTDGDAAFIQGMSVFFDAPCWPRRRDCLGARISASASSKLIENT